MPKRTADRPIVFFDGDCAFCNYSAQLLLGLDDDERLLFAPLQGETARELLPPELTQDATMNTMAVALPGEGLRLKSDAVIEILRQLGAPYSLAVAGRALPRVLRDALYDLVARNRRKLVKQPFCALPDPQDQPRFLP